MIIKPAQGDQPRLVESTTPQDVKGQPLISFCEMAPSEASDSMASNTMGLTHSALSMQSQGYSHRHGSSSSSFHGHHPQGLSNGLLAQALPPPPTSNSQPVTDPSQHQRLRDPNDKGAKQLIVKFLAPQVTETELRQLFAQFGPVEYSRMIYDANTGSSKGYGFVYYYRSADAAKAVQGLDSFELYGRYLRVGFAIPQRQPPTPPATK